MATQGTLKSERKRKKPLPIIGWREWVALPGLEVPKIKAKIDTGARSSSLHAFGVEEFERDGNIWVRFDVHPKQRSSKETIRAEAEVLEYRVIRSSSGNTSKRPVVVTPIKLGDYEWPVELTLARRDTMGFRMLLGREAFRGKFLVDAGRSYCLGPW